jgi:lysophospholipase L1-like esterase
VKIFLSCLTLVFSLGITQSAPLIQPNDTLVICGDSVTAQHQYSAFLEEYLLMCAPPTDGLSVAQFGRILEQSTGFLARLNSDVFPLKPTIATTCYGMNDGRYAPLTDEVANIYRKAQTDTVEAMKKNGVTRIILGSPKCVDTTTYNRPGADAATYNKTLGALADIDKDIAAKEGIVYADVFGDTMDVMTRAKAARGNSYIVCGGDGVHPDPNGHIIIAYAFLKALGFDGAIATVTVDLDSNHAEATPGTKVLSVDNGTVNLECSRYPFCFTGHPTDTDGSSASILPFVPFNEELNRYMLVVKGVKGKARVSWGGYPAQEFSGEDLAKGINLAAAFAYDNPFHGQFFKVDHDVQVQQAFEERLVQGFMTPKKDYTDDLPPGYTAMDQWVTTGLAIRADLCKAAAAQVVPIKTFIRIERE